MPFFSIVATSASATEPALHSLMKAASAGLLAAAAVAGRFVDVREWLA